MLLEKHTEAKTLQSWRSWHE